MSGFHYIEFEKTGSILLNAEEKDELFDYIDRLKAENDKLRELVRALDWHIRTDGLCADCPLGLAPDAPYEVMCDVMIEELGIEVDA